MLEPLVSFRIYSLLGRKLFKGNATFLSGTNEFPYFVCPMKIVIYFPPIQQARVFTQRTE